MQVRDRLARAIIKARGWTDVSGLEKNGLAIGRDVTIGTNVHLDPDFCFLISIGDGATITRGVTVLAHDGSTRHNAGYTRLAPVRIGNGVFIGAHSVILPGVTIGDDAIVGAGSIVRSDVEPGTVVAGNPARSIVDYDTYVQRHVDALQSRPSWPRDGWANGSGITASRRTEMLQALQQSGEGYIK